jgi:hypothetical protein
MNLRREPTYLSSDVWRACWLIAKFRSAKLDDAGLTRQTSPDEIAVELLRSAIKENYPWLLELQKAQAQLEDEAIKKLAEGRDKKAQ